MFVNRYLKIRIILKTGRFTMEMKSFFNTNENEINERKWNPYLGISINNKSFTIDYLTAYLNWASSRANQNYAIVVVDIIQHINNQIFDKSKPLSAIDKAFRKADEIRKMCEQAQSLVDKNMLNNFVLIDWTDLLFDDNFSYNLDIIKEEYKTNFEFKNALLQITKRNLGPIVNRLDDIKIEYLNEYLINELPELISGFRYKGIHYNLNVYPGKIASIYAELLEYDFFQKIISKLHLIDEIASVELYLENKQ